MDQPHYFRSHPPQCVSAFSASPIEAPEIQWDGHGEEINTVFALKCPCGANSFELHGYTWRNPDNADDSPEVFLSPIALKCVACGLSAVVFDSARDGYDAKLGHGASTVRAEGAAHTYTCENCQGVAFESLARFEYPSDLFDGDFDDFTGGKEELFTWASIAATCTKCEAMAIPGDFECA